MILFSLLLGLGASLGVWQVYSQSPPGQGRFWLDCAMLALLAALLGGRAGYVAFHFDYYARHAAQALAFWEGGYAWPGAVIGGLLAVGLLALFQGRPPGQVALRLKPLLGPLALGVWLGCWPGGAAYGAALPWAAWGAILAPDETGQVLARFPLQPLAALGLAAWLAAAGRAGPAWQAPLALLGLALDIGAASLVWASPTQSWNGLRVDTWAAAGLALFSLAWLALLKIAPKTPA